MIDKKIESDIKVVGGFLEFWVKFHSIYSGVVSKDTISKEEETKFLETKGLIKNKYDELKNGLDFKYAPYSRLTDPVSDILQIDNVRFMAENNLKKVEADWRDSYVFLNSILERLKNNKRRLEQFSPAGVYFKRFFEQNFIDKLRGGFK
ncbi:MAG: hypothetical protein Q8R38_08145 [Candidatus Omnitrophota bacterium]|nr:hypothetical protein [Candidatus Omnitrophota bacterium]